MQEKVIGPGANFQRASRDDHVARAIGIVDFQLRDELRRSERARELRVTPSGDVVHPVAQQHAQGVGPAADHAGHVIGLIEAALAIVGPAGLEQIVADLAAIEPELRLPQPASVKHGPRHRFLGLEFPAEDRQRPGGMQQYVLADAAIRCGSDPLGLPVIGRQQAHGPLVPGRCQAEGLPSRSHARTFQKQCWREVSGRPA